MLGLMSVLVALNQGHAWGWTSLPVIGFLSLGVAILIGFVAHERRITFPMLDLRLFRERAFAAPVVTAVLNFICAGSVVFLTPIYLLLGRGLSPAEAGLVLVTKPLVMCSITILSGSLSDRIGSRLPATLGMLLLSLGLFLLSWVGTETPLIQIVATLAIIGAGLGMFGAPNSSAVMGAVPEAHRGIAAAVLSTARTLGNTLGLGLAGAVFATVLAGHELTEPELVVPAVSAAFLTISAIALLGAVTSSTRPATAR
jgi:MFS family permease